MTLVLLRVGRPPGGRGSSVLHPTPFRPGLHRTSTRLEDPISTARGSRESGRILILVVERDPHVRELETYFLQDAGYDVAFASDGMEALTIARAERPDAVLTEILVPRLDGLALCREIKSDPALRGTQVLIFSVLAAAVRASEAGADAFLRKPLAEHSLLNSVQRLLSAREKSA